MRLKSFSATKVHGLFDFDINFNSDVSFLTGGNGCGKTTAIKLIEALFAPSLRELNATKYSRCSVTFEENGSEHTISSAQDEGHVEIHCSGVNAKLAFPRIDLDVIEQRHQGESPGEDYISELTVKFSSHPVIKFLSELDAPVILGLERRMHSRASVENERYISPRDTRFGKRRFFRGTLGVSLTETQQLAQRVFGRIRNHEDRANEALKQEILLSSFSYSSVDDMSDVLQLDWNEYDRLIKRRAEVESALESAGISKDKFSDAISAFFDRITRLYQQTRSEGSEKVAISLEWLVNKAQIDRALKLLQMIDRHKSSLDKFSSPFRKFREILNEYLLDSCKEIIIDSVGCMEVILKMAESSTKGTLETLSSGERQLVIIFSNLIFGHDPNKKSVFIIDEPELSLHLKWQSHFVESLISASANTQFVLATHSPEIVGERKDRCVRVRGSAS